MTTSSSKLFCNAAPHDPTSLDEDVPTVREGPRSVPEDQGPRTSSKVGASEVFVRVRTDASRGGGDRFVRKFLALMLAGVTDELVADVVATGPSVASVHVGDRVVVPATTPRSRVPSPSPNGTRILRIPAADQALMRVPPELRGAPDDQILFLYRRRLEWLEG